MLIRWGSLVVLVLVLVAVFIRLGEWQLDRLEERRAMNALVELHAQQDPVPYEQVMNRIMTDEDQWQPVTITGTYTGETFHVGYRNQGATGSEVLSVMEAHDGRHVLVDRGFIPRPAGAPDPDPPEAPPGEVTVTGYVQRDERGRDSAITPHEFHIRLIDSEAISQWLGRDLVNGYVTVTESSPADDPMLEPIALPELDDEGPHESYAWQWFAFTLIAVVGVVVLIRADIRDRRKAQRRKEQREARAEAEAEAGAPVGS
ncbi:MAG: SURF1 family protein [Propionibacterium sp.]|nr:SURF1 family protein [Propionibacterium sp.]